MRSGPYGSYQAKTSACACGRSRMNNDLVRLRGHEPHVYFIQRASGPIKIGYSRSVAHRAWQLKGALHEEVTILGVMPGDAQTEAATHRCFSPFRIRGEWFEGNPEIVSFALALPIELRCLFDDAKYLRIPVADRADVPGAHAKTG